MNIRLKLALRNIQRHQLRSFLSIGMISGGICSMIVFKGFSDDTLQTVKKIAADTQFGHIQIAEEKYWLPESESREKRMFYLSDLNKHKNIFSKLDSISGRISFFGLVNNRDLSLGSKFIGVDPQGEPNLTDSINIFKGKDFKKYNSNEVMIGVLLAKQLKAQVNDDITILATTVDGAVNALDLKVGGIFSSGIDEIDTQTIYIPLASSQKIMNTSKVDIAVGRFKNLEDAEVLTKEINEGVQTNKMSLKGRSWRDLASLFRQTEKFYRIQNNVIETILLSLMFLGILNAVSMTVIERTGEIGILRSMGETRSGIIKQFILESLLLTFLSIIIGILLSLCVKYSLELANVRTELPGASVPIRIKINFLYKVAFTSSLLSITTVFISTVIPAGRAVRADIVECLRRNI